MDDTEVGRVAAGARLGSDSESVYWGAALQEGRDAFFVDVAGDEDLGVVEACFVEDPADCGGEFGNVARVEPYCFEFRVLCCEFFCDLCRELCSFHGVVGVE